MDILDYKKQVSEYAQKCYMQGLMAGTSGNLSAACGEQIIITPGSFNYMAMRADDIMVIDYDGNIIEGRHRPSSEWQLHAEIYKSMPEVRSVVHTHSPYATAFAVLNEAIPVVLVEMLFFLRGDVCVAPIASQGSLEVGLGAAEALKGRTACLMQNHGAVTIGKDLPQAFMRAEYVENVAKVYHTARAVGVPTLVPEDMVREILNRP
jgi:L-fuculose-phosphate aldolase/L-ribulose-5-phosphate 4-epimerase